MNSLLSIRNIAKSYGSQQVLRPLSFEMSEGERICILGPSGCGKSTLLQMVAGLVRPDGGEIILQGVTVDNGRRYVPPERRSINMVFQDYALWPHMSIRRNIEFGMKRRKTARDEMSRRLEALRELLKLGGLLDRLPAQLSGGQQQRVGIARALATEPKLLLMDEPLSNLDVKLRTDMRSELAKLLGELAIATLYVTHDRMEAFTIADRILILRDGRVDQLGKPQELFLRPASPWAAQLMGYHNRVAAQFADGGSEPSVLAAGARIAGQLVKPGRRSGQALMLLHPEKLVVTPHPAGERDNTLAVTVAQSIYEGTKWRIIAHTADGQSIHAFHDDGLEPGSGAELYLPPDSTMLYAAAEPETNG